MQHKIIKFKNYSATLYPIAKIHSHQVKQNIRQTDFAPPQDPNYTIGHASLRFAVEYFAILKRNTLFNEILRPF